MRRVAGVLCLLLGVLLAEAAGAQPVGDRPAACDKEGYDPTFIDYPRYQREAWPKEAARFANNRANVSRQDRTLRLRLDDGRTVELVDCPHTDAAYGYLYDQYDESGRFYIVEKPVYEDRYYTLVMKKSGRIYTVEGRPVWAPDNSRFLTMRCGIGYPVNTLSVHALSGDGLATEAEISMSCASCSARWDNPSSIMVACKLLQGLDDPKPETQFVIQRSSDGTWKKSDR